MKFQSGYPDLIGTSGTNYTALAMSALRRYPRAFRERLNDEGHWPDVVADVYVSALESSRAGLCANAAYNAAQRAAYRSIRAAGYRRLRSGRWVAA